MRADELLPLVNQENADLRAQVAAQAERIRDLEGQRDARARIRREQDGAVADLEASQAGDR